MIDSRHLHGRIRVEAMPVLEIRCSGGICDHQKHQTMQDDNESKAGCQAEIGEDFQGKLFVTLAFSLTRLHNAK